MRRPTLHVLFIATAAGAVIGLTTASVSGRGQGRPAIVDFQALAADGQPVADLKPEDVSIRVAGRPRTITSLKFVRLASGPQAGSGLPAPFGTNVAGSGGGRQVAIIVEDQTLRAGTDRLVREALGKLLDGLDPADRLALAMAPLDTARISLGAGPAKVREALGQIQSRASAAATSDEDACRTRETLAVIRSTLASMAGSDTPSTVLFFSSKLSTPTTSQTRSGTQCDVTAQLYQDIGAAAAEARAQFYVIQQDDTMTALNEGLENLSASTSGGPVLRLAGSGDVMGRVLTETSAHYVATLAPDTSDRPGQVQRLEVRVSRGGVTTRARQDFAPVATKPVSTPLTPQQMLREARQFRDLPVRAVAYASRGTGGRMTVIVLGEAADSSTRLAAAAVALVDASGRLVAQATASDKELSASPVTIATVVPPGTYRMRFAATDAQKVGGAADYDVVADLVPAGPLKLGSLIIGALRNNAMAMGLQFRDDEKLVGYLEMYGQITGQVSARMEVAASLDGAAIATIQPGGAGTSEPDKFILTAEIPIAALAPGDYVIRAYVSVQGQPEGQVTKTFRKVAR